MTCPCVGGRRLVPYKDGRRRGAAPVSVLARRRRRRRRRRLSCGRDAGRPLSAVRAAGGRRAGLDQHRAGGGQRTLGGHQRGRSLPRGQSRSLEVRTYSEVSPGHL